MASNGICDRVAIVGMGCTSFGEHWDKGVNEMLVESSTEALESAGITHDDVDAYWLGTWATCPDSCSPNRSRFNTSPCRTSRTSARPVAKPCATRPMPSRPARTTSLWPSARRN
jgi:hypothetical protein